MIKIESSELNKFSVYIKRKAVENDKDIHKVLKDSAMAIQRGAMENLTSNGSVKTGHLRRGIANTRRGMTATVHTSNIVYAIGVEKGTRPHVIRPKNGKALYWKGAAHPVKKVNHPGSKPKPYLIPAFEKEIPYFVENLGKIMEW